MKPNKFAISLLAGMTLLSTNVISEEKSKHKGKSKSKPQKMTEVIEECVVDRETGRESCHVVSSMPVNASAEQTTTPVKTVEMPSELTKETTTECIGDVCTTTVVERKKVDAPETPKQATLAQNTQSFDRGITAATKSPSDTSEQRDFTVASANQNVQSDSRVALVIGNSNYAKVTPLSNPTHDADDMAAQLRKIGFDVVKYNNVKIQQIGSVLSEFRNKLKPGSAALVFYAGHGMQIKGENYFPVVDADIHTEEDVPNQSISLRQITGILEDSKTRLNLVFLDACRNNPYTRGFRSVEGGLARVTAPSGTLISYATRPGSVAADGDGRNGLYTSKLLHHMTSQREIELTLKDVLSEVKTSSKGKQEPWIEGAIEGNFCFGGCAGSSAPAPVSEPIQQVEQQSEKPPANNSDNFELTFWNSIKDSKNPDDFKAYLEKYPNGQFATLAHNKLKSTVTSPQTNTNALLEQALGLHGQKRYTEALPIFQNLAKQGNARAQFDLGIMYQNGQGVAQDDTQAVYWYRKAAEQGHINGQSNLGFMYHHGEGVAQDDTQAVYWYRKAAEQGHAEAQTWLGAMYQNGEGVAQDYSQAVSWYRKAVEQGEKYAQYNLGFMYANGRGVAQDDTQAVYWYRKAAEQGHAEAKENLKKLGL
jgi:TPR repeat protein